uniref:S-methyl-5'-thioadenosine phosphorylase n=1 Tax=Angiostrongylus cantonensis TaxID=6313 RepID=A0A0K0DJJ2_ANGCA
MPFKVGIIGGSGLEDPQFFKDAKEVQVNTPYGKPSDSFMEGTIGDVPCILLARHGRQHTIMPSDVNFRANLWGMHSLGASVIIASIACGSLQENVKPGELVFPDSVFDRTTGRKSTFFDGTNPDAPGVCHIQMHPVYNEKLRKVILMVTATDLKLKFHDGGFGICIEGPRYSSRAESHVFRSWGASIINMTMMPECCLAKELGIPYATTALVTDYDCWKDDEQVSMELVMRTFKENSSKAKSLFIEAVKRIAKEDWKTEILTAKVYYTFQVSF